MSRRTAGGRPFAGLSGALLLTAAVLLPATAAKLLAATTLLHDGANTSSTGQNRAGWPVLAAIEPRAGPTTGGATRTTDHPPATPAAATAQPVEVARRMDPASVAALEQLSAELKRHREALSERERTIALREAVVTAVESRIGGQLERLETVRSELERLADEASVEERARIGQLVKVYEAMKSKNAATIFDPMPLDLLLPIVRGMRETKVAAIVAEMDPAKARALTAELARARELPTIP